MQVQIFQTLFRPWETTGYRHKALSVVTFLALTILTRGVFLLPFIVVNLYGRNIQKIQQPLPISVATLPQKMMSIEEKPKAVSIQSSSRLNENRSMDKVSKVKERHSQQIKAFEKWADPLNPQWSKFETSDYDWWAFPIKRPSLQYKDEYAVSEQDIQALKKDPEFMQNYRRGVELVLNSWGWDPKIGNVISPKSEEQRWVHYGVRLGKMADSLQLFGEVELFQQVQAFAKKCTDPNRLEDWVIRVLKIN